MKLSANSKLQAYYQEIGILHSIQSLTQWDSDVIMPKGGAALRNEQMMLLSAQIYRRLSDPALADLILQAEEEPSSAHQTANITLIKRQYLQNKALDEKFVQALTKACLTCELNWREARANNDFKQFAKYFAPVLKLVKESAERLSEAFSLSPYDALLNNYDYGRKSAEIDLIFADLEQFLPNFIAQVKERQQKHNIISLQGSFDPEKQKELGLICMQALGFDLDRGRLDISAHPFSVGLSTGDTRITTRYNQHDLLSGLYGILHESGHAIYEQNLPLILPFQPVSNACGMTIHESQSLFIERQIGVNSAFFEWIAPQIAKIFGQQEALRANNLYQLASTVQSSLIRVDADEVTYPAHVILRYRLEKALLSGDLPIDELPLAWDEQMEKLLGIKSTNHSDGCLQDIHWAWGNIGYFPTYTLGAMFAAQINHRINQTLDQQSLIRAGNFKPIISWLNQNIHAQGSQYTSNELIMKATGSKLDSHFFKEYLNKKYL